MVFVAVPFLALGPGCGSDDCKEGESVCKGIHIGVCGRDGDFSDSRTFHTLISGCAPEKCVDLTEGGMRVAICSSTGQPDPRCADRTGLGCVDERTTLSCDRGYGSGEQTCAGACIPLEGGAFCSLEEAPNPACSNGGGGLVCDGASVVRCRRTYVVERFACEGGSSSCVSTAGSLRSYCATAETCDGPDDARCSDTTSIGGCVAGHRVSMSCTGQLKCEEYWTSETTRESECTYHSPGSTFTSP
jgi:hypothetical protein